MIALSTAFRDRMQAYRMLGDEIRKNAWKTENFQKHAKEISTLDGSSVIYWWKTSHIQKTYKLGQVTPVFGENIPSWLKNHKLSLSPLPFNVANDYFSGEIHIPVSFLEISSNFLDQIPPD